MELLYYINYGIVMWNLFYVIILKIVVITKFAKLVSVVDRSVTDSVEHSRRVLPLTPRWPLPHEMGGHGNGSGITVASQRLSWLSPGAEKGSMVNSTVPHTAESVQWEDPRPVLPLTQHGWQQGPL